MNVVALMIPPFVLWPWVAGGVLALIGLFAAMTGLIRGDGWREKTLAVSPLFFAAPLAAFGAEHLTIAEAIANGIPSWIPWHLFWAYFVGFALIVGTMGWFFTRQVVGLNRLLKGEPYRRPRLLPG